MELLLGGTALIFIAIAFTIAIHAYLERNNNALVWFNILSFIFSIFGILLLCEYRINIKYRSKPNAIDVYRGKTTLQVTYQDSVAVDSVVVFKNK